MYIIIFYKNNIFTAHSTLQTSLPYLLHPSRPVLSPTAASLITRWRIHVRLDVDQRYSAQDVTQAFTGCEELEVEAAETMFRGSGSGILMLFEHVRGVKKARVWGSVEEELARWLESVMMSAVGPLVAGV